jgi:hypothetical protein
MCTSKTKRTGVAAIRSAGASLIQPTIFARIFLLVVVAFALALLIPQNGFCQRDDILEVKALKKEIRSRFSLSERELLRIEPLIDQEGRKLVKMYVRFSGDETEYSSRVWDQVIEDRTSFEVSLAVTLSRKQKDAVRSARVRMEKKVLQYLVDDYMNLLIQLLDLNDFQTSNVAALFESDCDKKAQLVTWRLLDIPRLQREIEQVTDTTEARLKIILSADQWRMFLKFRESGTLVA